MGLSLPKSNLIFLKKCLDKWVHFIVPGRNGRIEKDGKRDMAYIKIFPIKVTDKKALDYIMNPDKTEEKLLISSFACSPESADLEFAFTREEGKKNIMDKGNNLAFHLIQSFKPGEIDAETAHKLLSLIHI